MKYLIIFLFFLTCLFLPQLVFALDEAPPELAVQTILSAKNAAFEKGWNYFVLENDCPVKNLFDELQAAGGGALTARELWVDGKKISVGEASVSAKIMPNQKIAFFSDQKFFLSLDPKACVAPDQARTQQIEQIRQKTANNATLLEKVVSIPASLLEKMQQFFNRPDNQQVDLSNANFTAQSGTFSDSLKVIGTTQLAQTTIGGSLQVGLLHLDDLKAEISSLTGLVTINSNLNVMGDATVSGQLRVEKGMVLKDTVTGEDYCVQITNGQIVRKKGECR